MKTKLILKVLFLLAFFSSLQAQTDGSKLTSETFSGLKLRSIGPALMAGRIADIAIHPQRQSTWYVAVGSGGVWKTVNAGTTWEPLFDGQPSYSVGCVTLDPNNPEVVWVGSGENVSGRHVGYGDGVYKSLDGGKTWKNVGLKSSEHISKILIDPRNSNVVYVASEGPLWAAGGERGLFKSTDGGANWTQSLKISENTGVIDLEFDPRDPDVLYAASYQRRRHIWSLLSGGLESGIYKSTDGGQNWRKITNGLPKGDMGKIGLAVSPINPDHVYATIEADREERGFYRSTNAGESWEKRNSYISGGTGPHYYQEIYASPHKLDRVYQMDVWMHITEDGGKTFRQLGAQDKHSDNHALAFDLKNTDYLLAGCDGGLYETWDHGKTWKFVANLPVLQIYKVAIDNDKPFYNMVLGTQDNNTQVGPSRTLNQHGIRNSDWYNTVGGDGYDCAVDPEDANIIYSEWQNGGLMRYDRRNGELIDIKPQPKAGEPPERWNWDAPITISPHSNTRLYYGSHRLWRSDDRGNSWAAISGDLTRNLNRYELKMMGRVRSVNELYDNGAMSRYSSLTTVDESPVEEGLIYTGSDDGLIHVTEDGGQTWRKVAKISGVPQMAFVNEIKASVHDGNTVFALFDNHKVGDFTPYIMKSTNRGRRWKSIRGDLPDRHLVWSIVQDHEKEDLLFLGTEFGIYFTVNGGVNWIKLTGGVPTIAFRDLEIQRRENDLVAASFGRGVYIFDDYSPLRQASSLGLASPANLFPVKDALLYIPKIPLGLRDKANQGGAYYAAPNPPFGAIFTYYLKEELKTGKERRRKKEKAVQKAGGDVQFPGYDKLQQESREDKPKVLLVVSDETGNVVRRIEGATTAGFHRVNWDLRYPAFTPTDVEKKPPANPWESIPIGPLAAPGAYSVALAKVVDGQVEMLAGPQSFNVVPLQNHTLSPQDRGEVLAFQQQTGELQRRAIIANKKAEELAKRMPFLKQAILETPGIDAVLLERAKALENRLKDIEKRLAGDAIRSSLWEFSAPSILARISDIVDGHWSNTYGPTKTHRDNYEIAAGEFRSVNLQLQELIGEIKKLEEDMDAAGAPWTPGRDIRDQN